MFETYENRHNPHVAIHRSSCTQLRKRGGEHKYRQGSYKQHAAFVDAVTYATATGLPVVNCSYCRPAASEETQT